MNPSGDGGLRSIDHLPGDILEQAVNEGIANYTVIPIHL